jgi:hypothetical protein
MFVCHKLMNVKSKILWLVWLIVTLGVLWYVLHTAAFGASPCPKPKRVVLVMPPPTQGAGANLLIAKGWPQTATTAYTTTLGLPKPIPLTNSWPYYFAVKAVQGELESLLSNITVTNWPETGTWRTVTLTWDASITPSVIANPISYRVYWGEAANTLTNVQDAGANLTANVRILPPPITNLVVTVSSARATNLLYGPTFRGPFTLLGKTNWTGTNPVPTRYWRAVGKSKANPPQVFIKGVPH